MWRPLIAAMCCRVTIHSLFQLPFGTYLPKQPAVEPVNQQYNTPRSIVRHLQMNTTKEEYFRTLNY
ncbi:hypothetical protein CS542_00425 [Pedobacter sp. IW39]|nr:hypothetical protein CS542_00425 [Pedobacter sp. IW39]